MVARGVWKISSSIEVECSILLKNSTNQCAMSQFKLDVHVGMCATGADYNQIGLGTVFWLCYCPHPCTYHRQLPHEMNSHRPKSIFFDISRLLCRKKKLAMKLFLPVSSSDFLPKKKFFSSVINSCVEIFKHTFFFFFSFDLVLYRYIRSCLICACLENTKRK